MLILLFFKKKIDLSENKIEELPETFGELVHLERLFLGGNNLSSFPKGFNSAWKKLTVLCIFFIIHYYIVFIIIILFYLIASSNSV